tara:strand:+ start:403 stop:957 length:555 start_codon:yes stop_codon:yes gene_type:complete
MTRNLSFIVTSKNPDKLSAAASALFRNGITSLTITGISSDSGIGEQPMGIDEAKQGASNRADNVRTHTDSVILSMESGITLIDLDRPEQGANDYCVVLVSLPNGSEHWRRSDSVFFPGKYVAEAHARGFDLHTVGSVIAEKTGCSKSNPHGYLTEGRINRTDLISEAMRAAIAAAKTAYPIYFE